MNPQAVDATQVSTSTEQSPQNAENIRFYCLIEGESYYRAFTVEAAATAKVVDLRDAVYKQGFLGPGFLAKDLTLFKVDIVPTEDLEKLKPTSDDEAFKKLSPFKELCFYWPSHPNLDHINVFVKPPALDNTHGSRSRKRLHSLSEDDNSPPTKRTSTRTDTGGDPSVQVETPAELQAEITAIHDAIKAIPDDLKFSDPAKIHELPFPSILTSHAGRFPFIYTSQESKVGYFKYMGRFGFRRILDQMEHQRFKKLKVPIYVYGTAGYGKSYLLAALVCQLLKEGKRVVYFPHCEELARDSYQVFLDALRFAYYDDVASLKKINSIDSIVDVNVKTAHLIDFWRKNNDTYLIADQLNALESDEKKKQEALDFLDTLRHNHWYICSASANEKKNRIVADKRGEILITPFYGGMDKDELEHWFSHYKNQLPKLTKEDYEHTIFQTGGIPLLLKDIFIPNIDTEKKSRSFYMFGSLADRIRRAVQKEFYTKIWELEKGPFLTQYYDQIEVCVANTKVSEPPEPELYDHRFFFFEQDKVTCEYRGRCTSGVALNAMLDALFGKRFDKFNSYFWYEAVEKLSGNRSLQGFIAKKIILRHIVSTGLKAVDSRLGPMNHVFFSQYPEWSNDSPSDKLSTTLYIPFDPDFEAIDGIILTVDSLEVRLFPIQITTNPRRQDSESTFLAKMWNQWVGPSLTENLKVSTTFVRIDREAPVGKPQPAVIQELRSGPNSVPSEYTSVHVAISQIDERLGEILSLPAQSSL